MIMCIGTHNLLLDQVLTRVRSGWPGELFIIQWSVSVLWRLKGIALGWMASGQYELAVIRSWCCVWECCIIWLAVQTMSKAVSWSKFESSSLSELCESLLDAQLFFRCFCMCKYCDRLRIPGDDFTFEREYFAKDAINNLKINLYIFGEMRCNTGIFVGSLIA